MALYRRSPGPPPAAAFGDLPILAGAAAMLLADGLRGGAEAADRDGAQLDGQAPDVAARCAQIDQRAYARSGTGGCPSLYSQPAHGPELTLP